MIGHPKVRGWYARHDVEPGRADANDPAVRRLAAGTATRDLGGSSGLNLLLPDRQLVLRVHKPFVSRRRLLGERALRGWLADQGLRVGVPIGNLMRCGPRWAELEQFIPSRTNELRPQWLFGTVGRLHRVLAGSPVVPVRPFLTTVGTPRILRRWQSINVAAGYPGAVPEIGPLLTELARQWVPTSQLPHQVVHGDPHMDNILLGTDGQPVYLDFANVNTAPRVFDLGYALAHLLMRGKPAGEAITDALCAYEESADWQLTRTERDALIPLAASVLLYYDICGWAGGPFLHITEWLLGGNLARSCPPRG